jgi:hypothetical protein
MNDYLVRGNRLRAEAKALVLEFMRASDLCQRGEAGMRLAQIFRACGFDWGNYEKATSSNQQYWVVALVRELEAEGKVERVSESGPWRVR